MRLSYYFLPLLKETPKEAQIASHRLMLRAGMIQQSSAGIYSWLPLGKKVLDRIAQIVREAEQMRRKREAEESGKLEDGEGAAANKLGQGMLGRKLALVRKVHQLVVDEFNAARLKMTAESTPHRQRARTLTTRSSLTAPRTSAQWPTRRTRPRRS